MSRRSSSRDRSLSPNSSCTASNCRGRPTKDCIRIHCQTHCHDYPPVTASSTTHSDLPTGVESAPPAETTLCRNTRKRRRVRTLLPPHLRQLLQWLARRP